MVYCTECGKKNDDDSEFCNKCGTALDNENIEKTFENNIKKVAERFEEKAEQFGKNMEKAGKRFEKKMDNTFGNLQVWYDKKFNIFGPIIWGFIGLIILRIIIFFMDIARDNFSIFGDISDFLYDNILIFFGLMILNSYNSYFNRNYKKSYRIISPGISTFSFTVSLWIFADFLRILDKNFDIPVLTEIASFINTYIIMILVVALILSYVIVLVLLPLVKDFQQK